jgi:hypothetical protein
LKFSEHFDKFRRTRPDRADITLEMCEEVRASSAVREDQAKGRTAYWGFVADKERYLKVVVEADSEEVITAH